MEDGIRNRGPDAVADSNADAGETLEAKLLEIEKKKNAVAQKSKLLDAEVDYEKHLKKYGPLYYLAPFYPALVMMVYILIGNVVLFLLEDECIYPLSAFLGLFLALCYIFLFFYGWMLIGSVPIRNIKFIKWFYILWGVGFVLWCLFGTIMVGISSPCAETATSLYYFSWIVVITFWLTVAVIVAYSIQGFVKEKREKEAATRQAWESEQQRALDQANSEKQRQDDLLDKIRREEEEARNAKRQDMEREAWRDEFYGSSSEDEEKDDSNSD